MLQEKASAGYLQIVYLLNIWNGENTSNENLDKCLKRRQFFCNVIQTEQTLQLISRGFLILSNQGIEQAPTLKLDLSI
jgi:hypothetical protein